MQKKFYLVILMSLVLYSCAHIGTVESDLHKPDFFLENQPIREVKVWVWYSGYDPNKIVAHIEQVSKLTEEQVGIRLAVVNTISTEWKSDQLIRRINKMYNETYGNYKWNKFDIAMGFGFFAWHEVPLMLLGMPVACGMIDDTYRRFIALKTIGTETTLHEVFHSLIFNHGHSFTGVMPALNFQIFPGSGSLNMGNYLTKADREEVLRNKWRDFSSKALLLEKYQKDMVSSK